MAKRVKSKVIECQVIIENPYRFIRFVFIANEIDTVVLDLQEQYPKGNITRKSILTWKYLTVSEYEKLQKEMKSGALLTNEPNPEVSDTTGDAT